MDTNFKFASLVGSVYKNGNVIFSPDGNTVISPVGNKISVFDLKNNLSRTLQVESLHNIITIAINNSGSHIITVNEAGHVTLVNMATETVLFKFPANRKVNAVEFSPDNRLLAITRGADLQIQELAKFDGNSFYPFSLKDTFHLSADDLTTVDWSDDSCLVACGGTDKSVRVVSAQAVKNVRVLSLGSHKAAVVVASFMKNSYDMLSVDKRGYCQVWCSSILQGQLDKGKYEKQADDKESEVTHLYYKKEKHFSVIESAGDAKSAIYVSSAKFHKEGNLLVSAFSNGVFVLHEIPSFSLIHNLRVSDMSVNTVSINNTGDWLALGCGVGSAAQLVVWEWQSETYVLKQQAHSQKVLTAEFSPDGSSIATGAEDGKVKIWNARNGFCTVTFDEHTSAVSAVCWTQSGKAILSASYDGTIRAHDLKRYRNFRTLACPEPTQLASLVVDKAGDIVCAAGKEVFNIFIWSMDTGHLLEVLSGHKSNISGIAIHGNNLVSTSWDRSVKVWNVIDSACETTELAQEGLAVDFSPCGTLFAVLMTDSSVAMYRTDDLSYIGIIETKLDVDPGRASTDIMTKKNSEQSKSFTCVRFSPDGTMLLLGGESNYFCLYSVADRVIIKKFTITENRSFEGVVMDVNRRNFTEFGNMQLLDNSDSDDEPASDFRRKIKLAGTKHMDLGERSARPEITVQAVAYCPTGRKFAICSTEGVGVYSLDTISLFDPFQLDSQTSPLQIKKFLSLRDFGSAIMASLRLNDTPLIKMSLESTPVAQVQLVVKTMPVQYAERLLKWVSDANIVLSSPHVHFYMIWIQSLLHIHGMRLKGRTEVAVLTGAQQVIAHHQHLVSKMADQNKFALRFLLNARKLKRKTNIESMDQS